MGLPQGSPLSPVLFNVYTKSLADLNQNGPSKILTLADDGLIYKTRRDSRKAAEAVTFFNVYTKGLAYLNQNGPSKILTLADDGLIYKT